MVCIFHWFDKCQGLCRAAEKPARYNKASPEWDEQCGQEVACAWGIGMVGSVLQLCHPDTAKAPPRHLVVGMFVISVVAVCGVVLLWRRWIDSTL